MDEYLVHGATLVSIGDAIREKTGESNQIALLNMPARIRSIQTGFSPSLVVTVATGAVVTATNGSKTASGTAVDGSTTILLPDAGTWTVSAQLNGQTSGSKTVSVTGSYSMSLTFFSATITVNAPSGATVALKKDGTTLQTKTSTGTAAFTVTETGSYTVEATQNGQNTSGTVNVVSGTTSYALTLSFVSTTLNNNTWDVVRAVSDAGTGSSYWSIGDRRAEPLNGTVGSLALNTTAYAFIVDFDHNKSVESPNAHTITFQFGKSALSNGADIAFCDSSYNSYGSSAAFRMNTTSTNSGGWNGSYMKKTIMPAFKAACSASLRDNVKTVTVYSDNTGGGSNTSSYVTATSEDFYLAAEYEIHGTRSYANSAEQNKQTQLSYYKAGNSKVKYKHSSTGSAVGVWCRSAGSSGSGAFCRVNTDGSAFGGYASCSLGLAPLFNI